MRIVSLVLACLTLATTSSLSQVSEWIASGSQNSKFNSFHRKDSSLILSLFNVGLDSNYPNFLKLYELDVVSDENPAINLSEIKSITFSDGFYTRNVEYIAETGYWLIVQSKISGDDQRTYRIALCNDNFDILVETSVETVGTPQTFFIDRDENNTYIIGSILPPGVNRLIFLKYDHSKPLVLPEIFIGQSPSHPIYYITSMNVDKRTGNLLLFSYSGIIVINDDLEILAQYLPSEIHTEDYGEVIGIDDNYFSHGARDSSLNIHFRNIVLHKYDTLFNIIKADTLGWPSQDNHPFMNNSITYNDDEILVGGHLDGPFTHANWTSEIKSIYLAKYDTDLNQIWRKEFGGDRAYIFTGLEILEGKDCIAYGLITDTISDIRYGYIMHISKDGDFISSIQIPLNSHIFYFEQYGQNLLRVNNIENSICKLNLFNINGMQIISVPLEYGINEIEVDNLIPGYYPYTIIKNNTIISTGSWMKFGN